MRKKLLGYYDYTVILTYTGFLSGMVGIFCVIDEKFFSALLCLMFSGVCDMFDGTVAATKERTEDEKCFGIQIDSLSDLVCFGVLPALYVYRINMQNAASFLIPAFYVLCALIRLGYFNVAEQNRQRTTSGMRKYYIGLPVTLSALFLPVIHEFCRLSLLHEEFLGLAALGIMGMCFLLPFKLKKPDVLGKICVGFCGVVEFLLLLIR